ncbi:HNH endonuclease signature motif containing protein [Streptomyces sp. NPDC056470]|uniref:HNH endonuclease signature motif containing protein n=1 Tax=Streptomyces sp. NPDC056470 TaxID=3345831 RepID=UPI0036B264D5
MAIDSTARKVLWARSSDLCAFPQCNQQLTANLHDEGSRTLEAAGVPLGEEAHIISGRTGGPRFDSSYPKGKIDTYENLILLCPTHHTLIDKKNGIGYSVETLRQMKADHETAQNSRKTPQEKRFEEIEIRTVALVESWAQRAELAEWQRLTWKLNVPIPRLKGPEIDRLTEQAEWLLTRNWPAQYPEVKRAFDNYGIILRDLIYHIRSCMEPLDNRDDVWEVYREYKHRLMTQTEYDAALAGFQYNCDILYELSLELTKSANFTCDAVRLELDPLFRFDEGILPHRVGDGVFVNNFSREEYDREEKARAHPYAGLDAVIEKVKRQGGASR